MSAKKALENYYKKQMASEKRRQTPRKKKKKNESPEKLVEKDVLNWAKDNGMFLHVVEAKAVYSPTAGRYLRGQSESGFPDLCGNFKSLSVWIELKAKGRRSTLKEHQRQFLVDKILQGCFACCVDSVEMLEKTFSSFLKIQTTIERADFLAHSLPKKRQRDVEQDDDECGF